MDHDDMQPEEIPGTADELLAKMPGEPREPSMALRLLLLRDDSRPTTITGPVMEWGPDDDYDEPRLVWSGKRGWRWFAWRCLHRR